MENASRALIMAASVLIGIVIISAFILMLNNLGGYQQTSSQATLNAQVTEFNNQFTTYARNGLRGSDMISLINKVIDYNNRKSADGYTELKLIITGFDDFIKQKLRFETDGNNQLITASNYDQTTISNIVTVPKQIENKYDEKYAKQLAAEITNIRDVIRDYSSVLEQNNEFDKKKLLPMSASEYGGVNQIYKDALVYHEYVQFKRTYFDFVGNLEYDSNTGRITKLEFKCTGVGV